MNPSIDREFISQLVIVLAVCAGAWMMLVQSKTSEISRLEEQMKASAQVSGLSSQDGIEALAGRFAAFHQRLDTIRRRNAVAEDVSSLYATIMRLATESHVRVQALQPTQAREPASGKPEPIKVARLEMTLAGSFENIAMFIDRVAQIDAFMRPSALQLIPIDSPNERAVSARFACDLLAFNIENTLSGVEKTSMLSPESMRRVSALGLFALPLLAVKIAAMVMGGSSPAKAGAATPAQIDPTTAPSALTFATVEWSAEQRAAAEHIRRIGASPFGPEPMVYTAEPVDEKPPEPTPEPEPEPEPVAIPLAEIPRFALQAVVMTPGGIKVVINGRSHSEGEIIKGWRVGEIDAEERSVVLSEVEGDRTVTLTVQLPN